MGVPPLRWTYPSRGGEHLQVQRVSGQFPVDVGQGVAGRHAHHEGREDQTLLRRVELGRAKSVTAGDEDKIG